MKIFSARQPDPASYVFSVVPGYYYYCADVAGVDAHLAEVLGALRPVCNLTEAGKRNARADLDLLLARRLYLQEVGEAPTRRELSDLAEQDRGMIA